MKNKKLFLEGERIYFRGFEREDVQGEYRNWINDGEVTQYIKVGTYPQTDAALIDYCEKELGSSNSVLFAIIEKESGNHIGNSHIYDIDWVTRTALRAVVLGDKSCWGKGYALEVIQLLNRYGFEYLNLNKLISSTCSDNEAIQRLNTKAGYVKEGVGRQEFFRNGRYYDRIYWGMLRSEYDALKEQAATAG
ncbi:MAG: GNAT family protein [Pseudomonadota bacterium]